MALSCTFLVQREALNVIQNLNRQMSGLGQGWASSLVERDPGSGEEASDGSPLLLGTVIFPVSSQEKAGRPGYCMDIVKASPLSAVFNLFAVPPTYR